MVDGDPSRNGGNDGYADLGGFFQKRRYFFIAFIFFQEAFFIQNKPVFASGIGNIFEPIQLSLKGYYLVLVKPDIFVSTKDAFAHITPSQPIQSLKEIIRMPVETWRATMKNDFEDSVFKKFPEIAAIKDKLYDLGAIYASMSGSGSSVYGIFREQVEFVDEVFNGCFCRQRALE